MADTARARKLSERIQQVVAQMLDTRIKDPRLGLRHRHRRARHG